MSNTTVENPTVPDPEKTVDLPPKGRRNPDPITNSPGSHPIETGVGAALGGAASGMAIGLAAGPAGAVVGAVAGIVGGAIAGGLAGKGVGELIDPTTEDNWIRTYLRKQKDLPNYDAKYDPLLTAAYRYGVRAESRFPTLTFGESESMLKAEWEGTHKQWSWDDAKASVEHGFDASRSHRLM
jgi:hypothetical protein